MKMRSGRKTTRSAPHITAGRFCSALLVATIGTSALPQHAPAVVVQNWAALPAPSNGFVGQWNGSSGVAIGDHWVLSARHVGGGPGSGFNLRGQTYIADRVIANPNYDLMLVHVNRRLPGWHRVNQSPVTYGQPVVLGGFGVTAGTYLGDGYDWSGPRQETWGRNLLGSTGSNLTVSFTAPWSTDAVANESIFAVNDSGAGLFVQANDGQLELAGIAISVLGAWGTSRYNDAAWTVNLETARAWINTYVRPSDPLGAPAAPPPGSRPDPVPAPAAGGLVAVGAGLRALRRRRPA